MTSGFNERFALPQDQQKFCFQATGTGTNTTSACDGIDHASLQDWLVGDLSTEGYGSATSAASTDPFQTQDRYGVQGANSLPDGTCSLAMLKLNRPPTSFMEAGVGLDDAFALTDEPQPGLHAGAGSLHGFGQGHPLDDSAFLLSDLSTDLLEGQPGYGLGGPLGSAWQTRVAPSFYAGDQLLAGAPAALQPIGYQNTLAQPGGNRGQRCRSSSLFVPPINATLALQTIGNESTGTLPPKKEPSTMLGHGPGEIQPTTSWEMRNNKYFCLHPGCRNPSFKRLGDLDRHQNNVHVQTKFFWCRYDGCQRGRPFPRKDKRNEHERKVHHVDYTRAENI